MNVGTQSVRTIVFDIKGNMVAFEKTEMEPYFSLQPGWAEQHPEYFWEQLSITSQRLFHHHPQLHERIKVVTLTTQRGTVVNLDKEAKPLRPAIVWLDQRLAEANHFPNGLSKFGLSLLKIRGIGYSICKKWGIQLDQTKPT